jgi:CheY-specific phosphatase CheX
MRADDLAHVASTVWKALGQSVRTSERRAELVSCSTGWLELTGMFEGFVAVSAGEEIAAELAASLFGIPPGSVNRDDGIDAIGEVTHMIGGALRQHLPQPTALSIPTVSGGYPRDEADLELLEESHLGYGQKSLVVRLFRRIERYDP